MQCHAVCNVSSGNAISGVGKALRLEIMVVHGGGK
jgi:hypothetical protein